MGKKYQLKNGLKVLLMESHKSPVVSIQMWVKTGSADEARLEEGLSHFIEHLVFKGTKKYKVGEIASVVEGSGGELNAYTSFDQTVFYVTISKQFVDVGLDVISQMMGFPTFDPNEIDNEREVVIEEIKRGEDSPHRQSSQMLFSTAYKKHPYRIPVIGYAQNIRKVSAKKIKNYFESRYAPRNMFLVVAGDFESKVMKDKVQKYFSPFVDYKIKKVKRPKEPIQKKEHISIKSTDFKEAMSYIAFKGPSVRHKDTAGLDVLAFIIGQGDSSRIVKTLRIEEPIVNSVGAFSFTPQDDGLLAFSASFESDKLESYFNGIKKEIINMITSLPTAEEMQKAVTNFASEQVYSVESVDGIARSAGSMEFYMGDPNYFVKFMKEIYALKPEDIQKLAKKYFDPKKLTVTVMTKEAEITKAKKITQNFIKDLKKEISIALKPVKKSSTSKNKMAAVSGVKSKSIKTEKYKPKKITFKVNVNTKKPETEVIELNQGVKLYFRTQDESPTCTLKMAFMGGLRAEPDGNGGLVELLSRVWPTETAKYDENEINHKIDSMAAGLSCFSGRNTIGFGIDFLSPYNNEIFELLESVLIQPTWNEKIIEREKLMIGNQIDSQNDNPSQICVNQFMKKMFDGHPYSKDMLGTKESIAKLKKEDFIKLKEKLFCTKNMTVCAVGDFDIKDLTTKMNKIISQMSAGEKFKKTFSAVDIFSDEVIKKELKKEQTHILLGHRGLKLADKDGYVLEVIQSILAGQGGRLFIELRDKNSLAYSVSPMKMEGIELGYFGAYIGCSPEKTDKAIEMMKIEFQKLCNELVPKDELLRSQRYLAGRSDIELQRKGTICNSILFDVIYGLHYDDTFKAAEEYFKVTAEDVQRVSNQIFNSPSIISIVGPK